MYQTNTFYFKWYAGIFLILSKRQISDVCITYFKIRYNSIIPSYWTELNRYITDRTKCDNNITSFRL